MSQASPPSSQRVDIAPASPRNGPSWTPSPLSENGEGAESDASKSRVRPKRPPDDPQASAQSPNSTRQQHKRARKSPAMLPAALPRAMRSSTSADSEASATSSAASPASPALAATAPAAPPAQSSVSLPASSQLETSLHPQSPHGLPDDARHEPSGCPSATAATHFVLQLSSEVPRHNDGRANNTAAEPPPQAQQPKTLSTPSSHRQEPDPPTHVALQPLPPKPPSPASVPVSVEAAPPLSAKHSPGPASPPRPPGLRTATTPALSSRHKPPPSQPGSNPPSSAAPDPQQRPAQPLPEQPRRRYPNIESQLRTKRISHKQLVDEVKGIYVGLAMVESKCIEIDSEQLANTDPDNKLGNEQWQALLALHRTLLHEHHDFMLASQHPSASPALRRVAQKYAMPARMWRHGIHSFLELLRHRLPASREHMITFIYMAYSIIALLYETVPAFEDTWIECLGDLSRYRMAIEEENQRVRDTWTSVSRRWYRIASDRAPTTGRLHHHLAILARPFVVTQMYYYFKSLCVPVPFTATRESIMTLLDPILASTPQADDTVELEFTRFHSQQFAKRNQDDASATAKRVLDRLAERLAESTRAWTEFGSYMGIVNCCALLGYGSDENVLMKALTEDLTSSAALGPTALVSASAPSATAAGGVEDEPMGEAQGEAQTRPQETAATTAIVADPQVLEALRPVQELVADMDRTMFSTVGNDHCVGYIHTRVVFMHSLARLPHCMVNVERAFPWDKLVGALNRMMGRCADPSKIEQDVLMRPRVDRREEDEKKLRDMQQLVQQKQAAVAAATGDENVEVALYEPNSVDIPPPPTPQGTDDQPLPEDWAQRGLLWTENHHPRGWFANMETMDDDEKLRETGSVEVARRDRVLWLAGRLAKYNKWIVYDSREQRFTVSEAFKSPYRRRSSTRLGADGGDAVDGLVSSDDSSLGLGDSDSDDSDDGDNDIVMADSASVGMLTAQYHHAMVSGGGVGDGSVDDDDSDDSDTADFEEEPLALSQVQEQTGHVREADQPIREPAQQPPLQELELQPPIPERAQQRPPDQEQDDKTTRPPVAARVTDESGRVLSISIADRDAIAAALASRFRRHNGDIPF